MAWACKVKNFAMAMRARKVCRDVMVPNWNVTQIVDIFRLVCQTVLKTMNGFKFIEALEVTFKKREYDPKTRKSEYIYKTAYSNSKAKTITDANEIGSELSIFRQEILNTIDNLGFRRFGMDH